MDIDYTEIIKSFQIKTDNYNEEEAFLYLEKHNWNERLAYEDYINMKNNKKQYQNKENKENNRSELSVKESLLPSNQSQSKEVIKVNTKRNNEGILSKVVNFLFCSK